MCRGNELPGTTGLLTSRCHQGSNACGETLALGLIKFPDFSMIWGIVLKFRDFSLICGIVSKFPDFSLTGKSETHSFIFRGFKID